MNELQAMIELIKFFGWVVGGLLALILALGGYVGGRVISKQDSHADKLAALGLNVQQEMASVRRDMNSMGEKLRDEMSDISKDAHKRIDSAQNEINFIKGRLSDTNPGFMVKT